MGDMEQVACSLVPADCFRTQITMAFPPSLYFVVQTSSALLVSFSSNFDCRQQL